MSKLRCLALLVVLPALLLAPLSAEADPQEFRDSIFISSNAHFDKAHGVRSGSGTLRDPYVISGWSVHHVTIKNTSRAVRIVDNTIGTLVLDWTGPNVLVRRNAIGDLRVNQNNKRRGAPTSGLIERNTITTVGQLRHFDGVFRKNVVGTGPQSISTPFSNVRAVNFDGFNGARFVQNTIYGYMDARLHGHHHSSGFARQSHMHTGSHHGHGTMVDHTRRWHQVLIEGNEIYSSYHYALAYLDTNHAANDRTAASERDKALNEPHVHRTRVHIMGNRLAGSGLLIHVFNANDKLHRRKAYGSVHVARNHIALEDSLLRPFGGRTGIEVVQAQYLTLNIHDNVVEAPPAIGGSSLEWNRLQTDGAGILLRGLKRGSVSIARNSVSNRVYGIQARSMSKTVTWTISRLRTEGVHDPVSYDSTVANKPRRR